MERLIRLAEGTAGPGIWLAGALGPMVCRRGPDDGYLQCQAVVSCMVANDRMSHGSCDCCSGDDAGTDADGAYDIGLTKRCLKSVRRSSTMESPKALSLGPSRSMIS